MGKCPLLPLIRRGCSHLLAQIDRFVTVPTGVSLFELARMIPHQSHQWPTANCSPSMEVSICHKWIWCLIASGLTNADRFLVVIILYLMFLFCRNIRICCWIARLQWTSIGQMSSSVRLHPDHFYSLHPLFLSLSYASCCLQGTITIALLLVISAVVISYPHGIPSHDHITMDGSNHQTPKWISCAHFTSGDLIIWA